MVENIVFVILVILAVGAGIWVWHMEVCGTPIVPPKTNSDSDGTKSAHQDNAENEVSA